MREGAAAVLGDELGEGVADHVFEGAAEALGAVGVDGEQVAVEVVGADHAERAFDELAVAGFALAEGGLGGALDGDVDAGGDDEADLSLLIAESGGGPGDAAEAAVAVEPVVLVDGGEGAGAEAGRTARWPGGLRRGG